MQEEQPHLVEKISKIERLKVRTQYFAIQLALLIGVWLLVSFVLDVSWGPLNEVDSIPPHTLKLYTDAESVF